MQLYRSLCFSCIVWGGSKGRVQWVRTPPEITCDFLIQLVFYKKKTMWVIGVEVEQETSDPLLKKILDPPLLYFKKIKYKTINTK